MVTADSCPVGLAQQQAPIVCRMGALERNWLLLEVLGDEPVVVAQGHHLRKFVPLSSFLRRNRNFAAITSAVAATIDLGSELVKKLTDSENVIRTVPVVMTDRRIHGVQVWTGPSNVRTRPTITPGAVVWNLTDRTATDSVQALWNAGLNIDVEQTHRRALIADMPIGEMNPDEPEVLELTVNTRPDATFSSTWDLTSYKEIYNAEDIDHAQVAIKAFEVDYGAKYPKAVAKIVDDADVLLEFYKYPAEHWIHLRTTNPIESDVCDRAVADQGHQGTRLPRGRDCHGLQADRRRAGSLAGRQRTALGRPGPCRRGVPQRQTARTTRRHHAHRDREINPN